ncbi:MAG: C40 family peptidase, partial [Oscillospiraceae bacterium]|nr:C40 family peptidase [Oscillospiraceae bacterium]
AQTKRPAPTPVPKPSMPAPKPTAAPPVTPEGSRYLPPTPSPVPLNPLGADIADYALEFYGCDYKYGGKSPETGFDCSGLVWYVYDHFGIPLNRTAADQAKNGEHVPPEEIAPGDIILFYRGGWIGHAGIYLGYGEYIHSMDVGIGVVVSPMDEIKTKIEIRRVYAEEQQE